MYVSRRLWTLRSVCNNSRYTDCERTAVSTLYVGRSALYTPRHCHEARLNRLALTQNVCIRRRNV